MSAWTTIDDKLVSLGDRSSRMLRRALRLSYPAFMGLMGLLVFPIICLGVFLSYGSVLLVKLPLLLLGAWIAATAVRQIYDNYTYASVLWSGRMEDTFRRIARSTRERLQPMRLAVVILTMAQVAVSAALCHVALVGGAGLAETVFRIVMPCLFGFPTVLAYNYLLCADPRA